MRLREVGARSVRADERGGASGDGERAALGEADGMEIRGDGGQRLGERGGGWEMGERSVGIWEIRGDWWRSRDVTCSKRHQDVEK